MRSFNHIDDYIDNKLYFLFKKNISNYINESINYKILLIAILMKIFE